MIGHYLEEKVITAKARTNMITAPAVIVPLTLVCNTYKEYM